MINNCNNYNNNFNNNDIITKRVQLFQKFQENKGIYPTMIKYQKIAFCVGSGGYMHQLRMSRQHCVYPMKGEHISVER